MTRTPAGPIIKLPNKKNIYIIGPRSSGKTTFLGALLSITKYSQNINHRKVNVDTKGKTSELESQVRKSWETKKPLEPTNFPKDSLQNYEFLITINPQYKPTEIELKAKDYGGEFFQELLRTDLSTKVKPYIKDCLKDANGWIVLLPDFCLKDDINGFTVVENIDSFYRSVFHKLLSEFPKNDYIFSEELTKIENNLKEIRIAFVMSKCERGELWTRRWEPERDLFQVHLKNTRDFLRNNLSLKKNQIAFFALSSFGVFSKNDPRPNRLNIGRNLQDGAIIDNGELWRPFGLVNPLYWIATGKKWKDPSF
mgnify:FL=1